jgi:hypothetical protein
MEIGLGSEFVMALIPGNLQITDIGTNVCLILFPGTDEEEVLYRYNPKTETPEILDKIFDSGMFDAKQKSLIYFWMGYFYAHMGRR